MKNFFKRLIAAFYYTHTLERELITLKIEMGKIQQERIEWEDANVGKLKAADEALFHREALEQRCDDLTRELKTQRDHYQALLTLHREYKGNHK